MSYNATTGQASCDRCGQLCQVGWNTDKVGGFTCGDCVEYRTPLKQEIARLRKALEYYADDDKLGDVARAALAPNAKAQAGG